MKLKIGAVAMALAFGVGVAGAQARGGDMSARLKAENDSLRKLVDSLRALVPSLRPAGASTRAPGVVPEAPAGSHPGKVTTRFDRAKNETVVSLDELTLTDNLRLTTYYAMPGDKPAPPKTVTMMLVSVNKKRQSSMCSIVDLLTDGTPFTIPTVTRDGSVEQNFSIEYFTWSMPTERFLQMIDATRIDGRVCDSEFSMKKGELNALRDLASRMK